MQLKYIVSCLLFLLINSSCEKDFLEVSNTNRLSESSFYQTEQDFEDLLITGYMPIGHAQSLGKSHTLNFAIDDRILHEQVNTSALQYDANNSDISRVYTDLFTGVFRTNLFLQKFTEDIKVSGDRRNTMLGEAHFLRGLYYYYLTTWYEVPPLLTEPAEDPRVGYENATQEELYAFVEDEFARAAELLPDTWSDNELGRATKGAALSFLGKTYLVQAKFEQAAEALERVINGGQYSLNMPKGTDSLDYVFAYLSNFTSFDLPAGNTTYDSEFNSESIFEINYSLSYDEGNRASEFLPLRRSTGSHFTWYNGYSSITGGFGNIAAEGNDFPDEFETPEDHPAGLERDPRFYAFFLQPGDQLDFRPAHPLFDEVFKIADLNSSLDTEYGVRKYLYPFHTKFSFSNAPFQDPNNWRLMRYAEVLLNYAEAVVRSTGNMGDVRAVDALNQVRERAGMPALTTLSREAIIHERDIELAGEHKRFWDLVRWYKDGWMSIEEVRQFKPTFEPRHTSFPIPEGEINRHYGVLQQNPKWL